MRVILNHKGNNELAKIMFGNRSVDRSIDANFGL
jgi:hypothetical protein